MWWMEGIPRPSVSGERGLPSQDRDGSFHLGFSGVGCASGTGSWGSFLKRIFTQNSRVEEGRWEIDDMFFFFLSPTRPAADNLLSIIWSTLSSSQEALKPSWLPHNVSGEFQTSLEISPSCLTKDNRVPGPYHLLSYRCIYFLLKYADCKTCIWKSERI